MESKNLSNNDEFAVSLLTPWIKGKILIDEDFLRVNIPNTVLFGLIPAGRQKDNSPLQSVSNVQTSTSYKLWRIIIGVLIAMAGISSLSSSVFGGLIIVILGVLICGSGIQTTFAYERSGIEKKIYLPFFESNHASELEEQVLTQMHKYQSDRNVAKHSQSIVDAINEK